MYNNYEVVRNPAAKPAAGKEVRMAEYKQMAACAPKQKKFLTATEVSEILDVSRSTAYRIIHKLNAELEKAGKITVAGKVSARYFYENTYL